jgi:hypothetical protein
MSGLVACVLGPLLVFLHASAGGGPFVSLARCYIGHLRAIKMPQIDTTTMLFELVGNRVQIDGKVVSAADLMDIIIEQRGLIKRMRSSIRQTRIDLGEYLGESEDWDSVMRWLSRTSEGKVT